MATYEESGVNMDLGDRCSEIAYEAAKTTFASRKGLIGAPLVDEGGFSGALDMGDYYLVQNDDGVGTKIMVAEAIKKYDTLGYDLVAMVADDAVCLGAEPISITNTFDVDRLDEGKIRALMAGLAKAASEHKIAIPGGEIAEVNDLARGYIWNATCVGIVEKKKMITSEKIEVGDQIIGLDSGGFRSNGFSLVRHILKGKFGEGWAFEKYNESMSWGEAVLAPSKVYCSAVLEMHGRYKEAGKVELKGVVNVTGGGIPGNLPRVLKRNGLGANLHSLPKPDEMMLRLTEFGHVSREEAYNTWNMGVGMILISNDFKKVAEICKKHGIEARIIGEVIGEDKIIF